MIFPVDGNDVFVSDGGVEHRAGQKALLMIHGSGMNHTVWALQSRFFAHRGINVFSLDLPGHGRSAGPVLTSIGQMSDWLDELMTVAGISGANLLGHSMGALIAIELAAASPARCDSLILAGVAASMKVHPQLLSAAKDNDPLAIELVDSWSFANRSHLGGHASPGAWMTGTVRRLLQSEADGVLFTDLNACDGYADAQRNFSALEMRATVIAAAEDKMTPARAGKALAESRDGANFVLVEGAGHNMMVERADKFNLAVRNALGV